jgi:hypothetical protein
MCFSSCLSGIRLALPAVRKKKNFNYHKDDSAGCQESNPGGKRIHQKTGGEKKRKPRSAEKLLENEAGIDYKP